ncbi:MAG: helix-turn-helix transcriptional regulator [Chloroflexi bacterium]|nr:helix-turn-helix transcriptional regulator [Ardenticatenaceae bacterium]MBL1130932.1 PadR family transcriptional regulator [Chloroflexota bacterium]NOG37028.1 helix-turn-helix transcriptional regulator [Chloroflexota bacterium]
MNRETVPLDDLLQQWEDNYKKGLLSFWILLLLHGRATYAYEMAAMITDMSQGTVTADEKSIYRALKRFEENGLIQSQTQNSEIGPPRRYYTLTPAGQQLLARFIERNIRIFARPDVAAAIDSVKDGG